MRTDLIRAVVDLREDVAGLRQVKKASYEEWLADNAQIFLIDLGEKEAELAKAEELLREAGLKEYEVTGDKKPFPGVGIRVREKVVYPPEEALLWANEHHIALVLDTKEFEKMMKDLSVRPSWVSLDEVPTATIATDLGAVLEGVGE